MEKSKEQTHDEENNDRKHKRNCENLNVKIACVDGLFCTYFPNSKRGISIASWSRNDQVAAYQTNAYILNAHILMSRASDHVRAEIDADCVP